jgi:hypothetical protein
MKVQLQIETHDRSLGFKIAGVYNALTSGTIIDVQEGVSIEYEGSLIRKSFGIPEILQFVIDASVNVDLALLGAWLYEKVKDKPVERIIVNRRVVTEITEKGIYQAIEEEFRGNE